MSTDITDMKMQIYPRGKFQTYSLLSEWPCTGSDRNPFFKQMKSLLLWWRLVKRTRFSISDGWGEKETERKIKQRQDCPSAGRLILQFDDYKWNKLSSHLSTMKTWSHFWLCREDWGVTCLCFSRVCDFYHMNDWRKNCYACHCYIDSFSKPWIWVLDVFIFSTNMLKSDDHHQVYFYYMGSESHKFWAFKMFVWNFILVDNNFKTHKHLRFYI